MELQSVRRYPQPQLPTHHEAEANPELLRLLPKRWQRNSAVLTAMVGAGLLLQCSASVLAKDEPARLMGDVAAPLVIMSESDARRIIVDEAKKAGINFTADKKKLNVPITALAAAPIKGNEASDATTTITLDGTDLTRAISYEYVSDIDTKAVSKRIGGFATAVSVSNALREESKKHLKGRVLLVSEVRTYDRDQADRQLRTQVQDFIKWLKAQGVI